MYNKLFSSIKIKGMELKNRIVLPAMGTKFSGITSYVTDQLIDYHVARTVGGTGLNIVEVASVHTPSAPKGFLSLSEDYYIPGMKRLTDAIHNAGGKAGVQLWQGSICVGSDPSAQILVASDMPFSAEFTIPQMTIEQIKEVVECYGAAAKRAVESGFDCVELHMAHNYLPHSFLSGGINHRTDEYGGTLENRMRFPLEIIRSVRENIPSSMPVFMRIDAHDDYLPNGLTIEDIIEFCKKAKDEGVDVLDVSRGNVISQGMKYEVPPVDLPRGFNIDNAARIRKETGMITIGVGRLNTPDIAEKVLEDDKVDMVVMGRAQLADPDFCNKAEKGDIEDIDYCIGCNQGCLDGFADVNCKHITCLRNPAVGREAECRIVKTNDPKTVLISGGGIAGLEAAIILKKRGHNPVLCEMSDTLGGQFLTAGEAPRKEEMKCAVKSMAQKAARLGVEIHLNTPVTKEVIEKIKPHTVINAIGAKPLIPRIPGADKNFVVNSHDVLNGKVELSGNIVVIGGGMVGMEVAEFLAQRGCKVTDLEMMKEFCADLGSARKICVTESIYSLGITPVTEVTVTGIKDGEVIGKKDGCLLSYPCDYAVMAIGSRSRDGSEIQNACRENNIAYFPVGDALKARRAIDATRESFNIAMTFDNQDVHEAGLK